MKPVADDIWRGHIADQLLAILPRSDTRPDGVDTGINPNFYYAALLLERLGYLKLTDTFGEILDQPQDVEIRTRWDDACHILLRCLEECGLLQYTPLACDIVIAMAESYGATEDDLDPEIDDTGWIEIAAIAHTSDAKLHPQALKKLEAVGLVASGHWTKAAIPILWRKWANQHPSERPADTPWFQERLETDFRSMPTDVARDLETILTFSDELLERKRNMLGHGDAFSLPEIGQGGEIEARRLAAQGRMADLEFLISQRWRFTDGWLSPNQMKECLFFGFDGLAAEMGHTLVIEKFPDTDLGRALRKTQDIKAGRH